MLTDVTKDHQWIFDNLHVVIKRRRNDKSSELKNIFHQIESKMLFIYFLDLVLSDTIGSSNAITSDSSSSNRRQYQNESTFKLWQKCLSMNFELKKSNLHPFFFRSAHEFESIDVKVEKVLMGNLTGSSKKKKREKENRYSDSKSFDVTKPRTNDEDFYRSVNLVDSGKFSQSTGQNPMIRSTSSTSPPPKSSSSKVFRSKMKTNFDFFFLRNFRSTDLRRQLSVQRHS